MCGASQSKQFDSGEEDEVDEAAKLEGGSMKLTRSGNDFSILSRQQMNQTSPPRHSDASDVTDPASVDIEVTLVFVAVEALGGIIVVCL